MRHIKIGNRIPKDYFVTKGVGESDITIHAGSYHLALKQAGIETANIMTYSSIMPSIATEIEKSDIQHGEVMECIISVGTARKGKRVSVGIIYGWLYDRISGEKHGGLVCERQEDMFTEELESSLHLSLNELYENGFSEKFEIRDIRVMTETITPKKKYGTAIVAICFANFIVPIID